MSLIEEDSDENLERTTLRKLAEWEPPAVDTENFKRFTEILDNYYPENWRSWEVNEVTYKDLFGEKITSDEECRLRFAIPTVKLPYIFGSGTNLSRRKHNVFKRTLLSWPLGRPTIYTPFATMKKIHPVDAFNGFTTLLTTETPHLITRSEAGKILKYREKDDCSSSTSGGKRKHSPVVDERPKRRRTDDRDETLFGFMKQQSDILQKLYQLQVVNSSVATEDTRRHPVQQINMPDEYWSAPPFAGDAQQELSDSPNVSRDSIAEDSEEEPALLNFAPQTKETEAKIGSARQDLVNQAVQCQRLGSENLQHIRYAEVQKKFQATPVFVNLKVNSSLAMATRPWQIVTILEKMDLCLGAISHGLLQQRKEFQDIYQNSSLEIKRAISNNFLSQDSTFHKTSDELLQYACGKRAETIQQRRSLYKPSNKVLNELLHAIPPSSSHLFSEHQLSELIKEQGGVYKFFPGKFKTKPKAGSKTFPSRKENRKGESNRRPNFKPGDKPSSSRAAYRQRPTTNKQNKAKFDTKRLY